MFRMNLSKLIVTAAILSLSCNSRLARIPLLPNNVTGWKIRYHSYSVNNYNSSGLLTTTSETLYSYNNEILVDSVKSIVIRTYDKTKLVDERDFTLEKDGSKTLLHEHIMNYDSNGNMSYQLDSMQANNI